MDEQLLIRFLTHTCTPEDLRSIDQWIASGKPNADWLFEMERIWSLKDELRFSDRREIEEAYNRFTLSLGKSKNAKPHFYIYPILKYVAAVIIIGLLGLNLYKMVQPATVGENTVEVPKGQRASLMLSDGTKIWLNSQSKLIYPTQFSDKERNVRLEGEAFFDVAHKEHLPFVVHSPLLAIKVLGTKFNFRDYPDDAEAIVSLSEGKVALNNLLKKEKEAFLLPNERVVLNKKNGRMHVEYSTVSNALQWTNGYLFFDEELLPDVVKELERSYNVKIQIASDTLNTFRFYGNFVHREQNIQEVLEALSATRKIHYIIEGHNITLY